MGIKTEHDPTLAWATVWVWRRGDKPGIGLTFYEGTAVKVFVDRWVISLGQDLSEGSTMNTAVAMAATQVGGGGMSSIQASAMLQAVGGGGKSNLAG